MNLNLFISILIAISLSMDAFSLAISIGTTNVNIKKILLISFIVSLYHFVMPSLGYFFGNVFLSHIHINTHLVSGIIFLYIAIQMMKEYRSDDVGKFGNFLEILMFGLGVSIDSFGVGFTYMLPYITCVRAFILFSISSFIFTFIGAYLGKTLNKFIGKYAILIGFLIMLCLSILNFVKFCSFN